MTQVDLPRLAAIRIRVEFGSGLLPQAGPVPGANRFWYCIPTSLDTIGALTQQIVSSFEVSREDRQAADICSIILQLDGFVLLPSTPLAVLRDGDLIAIALSGASPSGGDAIELGRPSTSKRLQINISQTMPCKKQRQVPRFCTAVKDGAAGPTGSLPPAHAPLAVHPSAGDGEDGGAIMDPSSGRKAASRSARRKAAKRLLRRTGVLPYGGKDKTLATGSGLGKVQGSRPESCLNPAAKTRRSADIAMNICPDSSPIVQGDCSNLGRANIILENTQSAAAAASHLHSELMKAVAAASPFDPSSQSQRLPARLMQDFRRMDQPYTTQQVGPSGTAVHQQPRMAAKKTQDDSSSSGSSSADSSSADSSSADSSSSDSSSEEEESSRVDEDASAENSSDSSENSSEESSEESSTSSASSSSSEDESDASASEEDTDVDNADGSGAKAASGGEGQVGSPAVEEEWDFFSLPLLDRTPAVGSVIAYKILELQWQDGCPVVSDPRRGLVTSVDSTVSPVMLTLAPWPNSSVHPMSQQLAAWRASLEEEEEEEETREGKVAVTNQGKAWPLYEESPFQATYEEDGTLIVSLNEFFDARLVRGLPTGEEAPRVPAAASSPMASTAHATESVKNLQKRGAAPRAGPSTSLPQSMQRGLSIPAPIARGTDRAAHGPPMSHSSVPPPPPLPSTYLPTPVAGPRQAAPDSSKATPAQAIRGPPTPSTPSAMLALAGPTAPQYARIIPRAGPWAAVADELQKRKQQLSQGEQNIASGAGTQGGSKPDKSQASAPAAVSVPGAVRPRVNVRRSAVGPLLQHLQRRAAEGDGPLAKTSTQQT